MTEVRGVVTVDTGRDISELVNAEARRWELDAVGLLGGLIAESGLREHAARERAWPDVSYGLGQQTVMYATEVPGVVRAADGTVTDTPSNRALVRAYFFDAASAIATAAKQYAYYLRREGDPLNAWCRFNWPSQEPINNPNRANYARGLAEAQKYGTTGATQDFGIRDERDDYPYVPGFGEYDERSLSAIQHSIIHYSYGPYAQTVRDIYNYQTSWDAKSQTGTGKPFPTIAYHLVVTQDGVVHYVNGLQLVTWHDPPRNASGVGICFTSRDMPNASQMDGLARAIVWCEQQVGRQLIIEGHKDAYNTSCPGPSWPGWKPQLVSAVQRMRVGPQPGPTPVDVTGGFRIGGFRAFLEQHPEYGTARMDEQMMVGGSFLWTTPTEQHSRGCLIVWRKWISDTTSDSGIRAVTWD